MSRPLLCFATGLGVKRSDASGVRRIAEEVERCVPGALIVREEWDFSWRKAGRDHAAGNYWPRAFCGHSYGWGVSFLEWCAGLADCGAICDLTVGIDAVPRWWINMLHAIGGFVVRHPVGVIALPPNARRCTYFRQVQGVPYGRIVTAVDPEQFVEGTVYLHDPGVARLRPWEAPVGVVATMDHDQIDSWPPVRKRAVELLSEACA